MRDRYLKTIKHFKRLDILECFMGLDLESLALLTDRVLNHGATIVEVGSWKGASTAILAAGVKYDGGEGRVYAVDHWKGSEGVAHHHQKHPGQEWRNIFNLFKANMASLGFTKVVTPICLDSVKASKQFEDGSLDMVFLDGDHRYKQFLADVKAWFPKVRPGGIICGHDCEGFYETEFSDRMQKVIDGSLDNDYIHDDEANVHPGIVKGLHDFFGDDVCLIPKSMWYHVKVIQ